MTRTEERLTDALTATADAIGAETLRPLMAPGPRRNRRHVAWVAPITAAASVLLITGLAVAGHLSGTGPGPETTTGGVPPYYVGSIDAGRTLVVRSVVTSKITVTVPIPAASGNGANGIPVVASARNGTFFAAIYRPHSDAKVAGGRAIAEQIYRFQVTQAGQITGFAPVPGGRMPLGQDIDAMAASPDGSLLAVGVNTAQNYPDNDQIIVIHTRTGAQTVWRGATVHPGQFGVDSLSFTADGHELAVLGQWCQQYVGGSENCRTPEGPTHRTAEVWALNPASGGGLLSSGHLLLRESARNPSISQAVISPDGSVITAVVLTTRQVRSGATAAIVPGDMVVRQISVATGKQLRVIYRVRLAPDDKGTRRNVITLSPDISGRHWIISAVLDINDGATGGSTQVSGPLNGWIRNGKLVPLDASFGNVNSQAW